MTSQVFHQFEVEPQQPFMLRDILPGPGWAPFQAAKTGPAACEVKMPKPAAKMRNRWATVLAAVCFEVAIPLGVFGIWQVWVHVH